MAAASGFPERGWAVERPARQPHLAGSIGPPTRR